MKFFCCRPVIVFCCLACLFLGSQLPVLSQDESWELDIGGWIRAEYGEGDRYSLAVGEDSLGVSEAALLGNWKYKNVEAVLLLGAVQLTGNNTDGDIGVKDAFIIWKDIGGVDFSLRAGVQPLLFGLKPDGFPGDRSLQASLEYGGAGGFNVSQQAGPAIVGYYQAGPKLTISGGFFDTSSSTFSYFEETGMGEIDGSSLSSNTFLQLRYGDPKEAAGFYGLVGAEQRYIGNAVDSSESIFDVGVGYHNSRFDLSLEVIDLDANFTGTVDDETYIVAELTFFLPGDRLSLYFDYAEADQAELETLRAGLIFAIHEPLTFHLEFSEDDFGRNQTVDSVDIRLQFSF